MVADDYSFTFADRRHQGRCCWCTTSSSRTTTTGSPSDTRGHQGRAPGTRPSYTYQLEAFAAHVLHGAPLPLDTADAVENMAYVDAAYRAAG